MKELETGRGQINNPHTSNHHHRRCLFFFFSFLKKTSSCGKSICGCWIEPTFRPITPQKMSVLPSRVVFVRPTLANNNIFNNSTR